MASWQARQGNFGLSIQKSFASTNLKQNGSAPCTTKALAQQERPAVKDADAKGIFLMSLELSYV